MNVQGDVMGDVKLFRISDSSVTELIGRSVAVEKTLQTMIEQNLDPLLGIRFLSSEYKTGSVHGGRIDTLGIDENNSPVIIEYKRALNENVINQGLYYLDWLLDHRAEFEQLVTKKLGGDAALSLDWSGTRLLCIAGDFKKYDEYAVRQINRNIELIRYKRFGEDLLFLDLVNAVRSDSSWQPGGWASEGIKIAHVAPATKTVETKLAAASIEMRDRFDAIKDYCLSFGEDVQVKMLKHYVAFSRIKNFACVEIKPQDGDIVMYLRIDPETIQIENGFTRDMRSIGHMGTGDLEVIVKDEMDWERAKPLLARAYEAA